MKNRFNEALEGYRDDLLDGRRILLEVYKFECAHYVAGRVNWDQQEDEEVLAVLRQSQKLHYTATDGNRGVNFMVTPLRFNSELMTLAEVKQYRLFGSLGFEQPGWSSKPVTYPIKSAWLAALYPGKVFPTGKTGFDATTHFLFGDRFTVSRQGIAYLKTIQGPFRETEILLRTTDVGELWLKGLQLHFGSAPDLELNPPKELSKMDWAWITQDFHFYILDKRMEEKEVVKNRKAKIQSYPEPFAIEGDTRLAYHLRRDRSGNLARQAKEAALKRDPLLYCSVCDFSFVKTYGEMGAGYIEAHHLEPLGERTLATATSIKDFAMVCANCHRMLHRGERLLTVKELREIIKK